MTFFPQSSTILEYCGIWPSPEYYSGWTKILYDFYTLLVVVLISTFCLSGVIQLSLFTDSVTEFAANCYMLMTFIAALIKIFIVIWKRHYLPETLGLGQPISFQLRNQDEKQIQELWDPQSRFDSIFSCNSEVIINIFLTTVLLKRFNCIILGNFKDSICLRTFRILVAGAIILVTISAFKNNIPTKTLPFNGWFPYSHTDSVGYWFAFTHQLIAHGWGAMIDSTIDTVIYGTMLETCAQLNILKYRLRKIPEMVEHQVQLLNINYKYEKIGNCDVTDVMRKLEDEIIVNCIQHHLNILQFTKNWKNRYAVIIFLQFSTSGLVLCISVYMLTTAPVMTPEFFFLLFYVGCMLVQIFNFCWFGNEVILESSGICGIIYEMNWSKLSVNTQKNLMMIMARSMYPIEFTSGHVVVLSIDSFNALLKLSYSMYSVLGHGR